MERQNSDGLPVAVYQDQRPRLADESRPVENRDPIHPESSFYYHNIRLEQPMQCTPAIQYHSHLCQIPCQTTLGAESHQSAALWSPPEEGKDFGNYSYQGSPASCGESSGDYKQPPISPVSWSSPRQMPFHTPSDHLPYAHQTPQTMGVYSPSNDASSAEPSRSMMRQSSMPHSYSMVRNDSMPGARSPIDAKVPFLYPSPSTHHLDMQSPFSDLAAEELGSEPLSEAGEGRPNDEKIRAHEPYARLIYKALMSSSRHAMTLQEIYQWFRDNTDKAQNESKGAGKGSNKNQDGWKNSIRHNLSMNKVSLP